MHTHHPTAVAPKLFPFAGTPAALYPRCPPLSRSPDAPALTVDGDARAHEVAKVSNLSFRVLLRHLDLVMSEPPVLKVVQQVREPLLCLRVHDEEGRLYMLSALRVRVVQPLVVVCETLHRSEEGCLLVNAFVVLPHCTEDFVVAIDHVDLRRSDEGVSHLRPASHRLLRLRQLTTREFDVFTIEVGEVFALHLDRRMPDI